MKLKNKKTGEIGYYTPIIEHINGPIRDKKFYDSLAELNEEWEDYEEPKEYWFLSGGGDVIYVEDENTVFDKEHKLIGNYFSSIEEAEKAVEKLKAWKRLKDKGFRFIGKTYETDKRFGSIFYKVDEDTYSEDIINDLELLFSGGDYDNN